MYVRRDIESKIIWYFSWQPLLIFTSLSALVYVLYVHFKITWLAVPFLPVATIGTAVAFYLGFKNNASYERLWEARKIWAEIEHLSRFWAMLVLKQPGAEIATKVRRDLVYRQIAWINCLRIQLRNKELFLDQEQHTLSHVKLIQARKDGTAFESEMATTLRAFASEEELQELKGTRNVAVGLLHRQIRALAPIKKELGDSDYEKLLDIVSDCSQQQAAAERISSFPFPRQYAYMSTLFVWIFVLLVPFSLIGDIYKSDVGMAWISIPCSVLISWVFHTMEKVGDTSENPFENGLNDVPMTSICREVEIDLKSMLKEKDLPAAVEPVDFILL